MKTPMDDAQLELLLKQLDHTPLPDDGFSSRVMQALPPPRRTPFFQSHRRLLLCSAALLAAVLAAWPKGGLAEFKASLGWLFARYLDLAAQASSSALTPWIFLLIAVAALRIPHWLDSDADNA